MSVSRKASCIFCSTAALECRLFFACPLMHLFHCAISARQCNCYTVLIMSALPGMKLFYFSIIICSAMHLCYRFICLPQDGFMSVSLCSCFMFSMQAISLPEVCSADQRCWRVSCSICHLKIESSFISALL